MSSSYAYKHSESFAKLKSIKESIENNLTSFQYLSVLDELLYRAVYPIIESTRFVDVFLAQMLGWQTLNPKRKTSGLGRHAFGANTTLFLLSDSPKQKLKILKRMRLDRSMLFEILNRWFEVAEEAEKIGNQVANQEAVLRFHELQEKCLIKSGYGLTSTYRVAKYWHAKALSFKHKILEKYTRKCLVTAKRDFEGLEHKVDLDDIVQVYLLTASKAIDKCDTERGVLTTHVDNWLKSAKNVVVSRYITGSGADARSVVLNTTTNNKVVDDLIESASLEDVEELSHSDDEVRERNAHLKEIRMVARAFDPQGFGRVMLHIQEELSEDDKARLRSLAVTDDWSGSTTTTPVNV